jgi:hypothetical protein
VRLPATHANRPERPAFAIPDLLLIKAWADFHDLQMTVRLDFSVNGSPCEEAVCLRPATGGDQYWVLWRSRRGIAAQVLSDAAIGLSGGTLLFDATAEALELLIPACD